MASTFAPAPLKAARLYVLDAFGIGEPTAVGIVGDISHRKNGSSYHLGAPQLRDDSYSIVESSRDRHGLSDAASALDIGKFTLVRGGKTHTLRTFSVWLVRQCEAGTDDTRDIREVIYSPDGKTVKRWDRLGRRSTGDSSHLEHTHISYFRDSENHDKTALFRRYIREIEGDVMTPAQEAKLDKALALLGQMPKAVWDHEEQDPVDPKLMRRTGGDMRMLDKRARDRHAALLAAITGVDVDEQAVAASVLAGLTPERIAAAIPGDLAQAVVDELHARTARSAE
ncbi:hypothetical protein [Actinoplanes teichomyceticus]|uniref:Uncharacterized protein n=1 Tax=Actinoplanes teichomyceticus TaxID=1867 RepID=A0A561WAR6_ACTTI|nr:hypothetical protein [Actinoplanes teichomyceticus]TWG20954.1 hypothetical protein FHX34_103483 [Actinoplanes teichomyceticus]GIF16540.1 hypothetical protein Ate01nite_65720 [Actinoplanes teichomyceticus]